MFHVAGGFPIAFYLLDWLTWPQVRLLYVGGLATAGVLEGARLLGGIDWWVFRELTREYEQANPAGYALYVAGSAAAAVVFEPHIAVPAVLMLAIADPISGLLAEPRRRPMKRPLVLGVTFAVAGTIGLLFVPLAAAVAGAAVATFADGATPVVSGYVIDDNLGIPIGAATAMWFVLRLPL